MRKLVSKVEMLFFVFATAAFTFACTYGPTETKLGNTPLPNSGSVSARDEVVIALKKWTLSRSFRQRFTSEIDGQLTRGTMDFVSPDRVHLVMNIAGELFESITIGTIEYSKDIDGKWIKTTLEDQSTNRLFADPRQLAALSENIIDAQFAGSELVEGTQTRLYKIKHKLPGLETVYESRIWIGNADSLPRKFETEYEQTVDGIKRTGKSSGIYYDYNSDIRIEPPVM